MEESNPPFVGVLFLTILAMAPLVAIVSRSWVLHIEPVTWRGIDVPQATDLVALYAQSVHDHRIAFPTGVFLVDPERSAPGYVCAREANFKRTRGLGVVWFFLFWLYLLVDTLLRWMMRSRVEAFVEPHPVLDDAVTVRFELRGMSAYGIEDALRRGISTPTLPPRFHQWAGVQPGTHVPPGSAIGRWQIVLSLAAVVAVLFSAVVSLA